MQIKIRQDHVEIEGYVNAIERNSKPLSSRLGEFVEKICKGAFGNAIKRNDDIHILLNHDWDRDLGSTKKGNLELEEDAIGLKAKAEITDPKVIESARNGDLVGWSFGFADRDVTNRMVDGKILREVKDLDLYEVSILDRSRTPAYEGTLITARSENDKVQYKGMEYLDEVKIRDETENIAKEPDVKENSDKREVSKEYYTKLWEQIKKLEE